MAVMSAIEAPTFRATHRRSLTLLTECSVIGLTLLVLFVLVYPTAWIFIASFRTPETMFAAGGWVFTIDNYVNLLKSDFSRSIFNSLFLCLASVLVSTFVSVIAAYVFSRIRFRAKRLIFGSVILGQTFPWIILVTPLFVLFARLGLLNSYLGMIFIYVSVSIPFSIYLLVGYLESVPRSLDEAAIIDGCSQFQVIWRIIVPVMLPGIVATATYAFLLCWSEYLFALAFLTETELKTMPLLLNAFFGENVVEWGNVMAGSALTTLPTLILFLPLQTKMTSGLAAGSVKQ
ncbi:MAG: carbohydrate ABC transporter permease [Proteobacteria bacterium]|nr:carbohydrate ABC transporter permease [Pseudomonadota bacterium]